MLRIVLASLVLAMASAVVVAEVIELEGTIKAIDADARTIEISRTTASGEKTLKLDVAKTAGDLTGIKEGDKISIAYDPTVEIVTKIASSPSRASELVILKELRKAYNTAPWVSEDGLRLYWQSAEADGTRWIWSAARAKPTGLFENQTKLVPGSDCSLTGDELLLFVFEAGTICVSARDSRESPFPRPEPIAELKPLGRLARPCVSSDGLILWFDAPGKDKDITYRVSRKDRQDNWSKPEVVDRKVVGFGNGFVVNANDGYGLFATATPLQEGCRFAFALTDDQGLSFKDATPLNLPANADGKFPFYCHATNELFFAGQAGPDKTSQLYVVRNFTLPHANMKKAIAPFNGRDLSGWQYVGNQAERDRAWGVEAEGKRLVCRGNPGAGTLLTDEKYRDFVVTLEWRIPEGVTPTQDGLGLLLRYSSSTDKGIKALRYQLNDRPQVALWILGADEKPSIGKGRLEASFKDPLVLSKNEQRKPLGQWNALSISCIGDKVSVTQNGEEAISVSGVDSSSGHIGFQPSGTTVELRNIQIQVQ